MGCAVAPLAGLDCNYIVIAVRLVYVLLALGILGLVLRLSSRETRPRRLLIALAIVLVPPVYLYASSSKEADQRAATFHGASARFEQVCFERAHETIYAQARLMRELVLTPERGPTGAYGFDLFYGSYRPKTWGSAPITLEASGSQEGVFELRYSYLPDKFIERGTEVTFHGMKMEVVDRASGVVLAERLDYLWGGDFNRGSQCLGSSWYADNNAFAERVLGPQSLDYKVAGGHGRRQQRITQATLTKVEPVDKVLGSDNPRDALPPDSDYDYNNRTIRLKDGAFKMLGYGNAEPIPIVATVSRDGEVTFFMLPQGWVRSRPLRLLLVHQRKSTGEELRNTFVQVPPGVDWSDGWGFDKADVSVSPSKVSFSIYGAKVTDASIPTMYNQGRYRKRFVFEAPLPKADD